jgi:hypothetical protein
MECTTYVTPRQLRQLVASEKLTESLRVSGWLYTCVIDNQWLTSIGTSSADVIAASWHCGLGVMNEGKKWK